MERIVVTGDLLRPSVFSAQPSQNNNIEWFSRLISPFISAASPVPVSAQYSGAKAGFDPAYVYHLFGRRYCVESWAELYDVDSIPYSVLDYIHHCFARATVVGFELPVLLKRAFLLCGIEYLDFIIHPAKFSSDLFFGVQASVRDAECAVARHAYPEEGNFLEAYRYSRRLGLADYSDTVPDTLLICGQTVGDKVLIRGGKFVGFGDFIDQLEAIAGAHRTVLFKRHPYVTYDNEAISTLSSIPGIKYTNEDFYNIVASKRVSEVVSISSGTCIEARYFGVKGTFLYKQPFVFIESLRERRIDFDYYIPVRGSYFSKKFWESVLFSTAEQGVDQAEGSHLLYNGVVRDTLRVSWAYKSA